MDVEQIYVDAAKALEGLSELVSQLEGLLLELDEDRNNTSTLTSIIQGLFSANSLIEVLLHEYVPQISRYSQGMADTLGVSVGILMHKTWSIQDDLEVMTKVKGQPLYKRFGGKEARRRAS